MTSQSGAAAAWDAEYTAGRYSGEPPVAFTGDILFPESQIPRDVVSRLLPNRLVELAWAGGFRGRQYS